MRRSAAACALLVALLLAGCGGSSANRNIGRGVQREFQTALDRIGGGGRLPAKFAIDRCVGQQLGVALRRTTAQDVLDVQQNSDTLLFHCTVTQSAAASGQARWNYDLQVDAQGKWQASLHSAARGAGSCSAGECTGPGGLTPPLSVVAYDPSRSRTGSGSASTAGQGTSPAGPAPQWGKGLVAMSDGVGARALAQAHVTGAACLAVATVDGYPTYALAESRRSSTCESRASSAAQKYVLERHDGAWEPLWQGSTSCPPALPAKVIRVMFHVAVSSCWDS